MFRWAYRMDLGAMLDMDSERYELHRQFAESLIEMTAGGRNGNPHQ